MAVIQHPKGDILVDDDIAAALANTRVGVGRGKHVLYARFWDADAKKTIILHRWILQARPGQIVDHIDGNGLNNQRANLRICSSAENTRNRRKLSGQSTPYKGVHNFKGRFQARIGANAADHYLGCFETAEAAAHAYDEAARRLHGQFASLNFPRPGERSALQRLSFHPQPNASERQHDHVAR